MKAPICEACLTSELLCSGCADKLISGEITQLDIDVSRALPKLVGKAQSPNLGFERALDVGECIIVVASGNISQFVGKGGRVVRTLSEKLGKSVRVVKDTKDLRTVAQDLLFPARIFGINVMYSLKGEQYRLIVPAKDKHRLALQPETLNNALEKLTGKHVDLEFKR